MGQGGAPRRVVSLVAATATGAGRAIRTAGMNHYTFEAVVTGQPTSAIIQLQGRIGVPTKLPQDDTTPWSDIGTALDVTPPAATDPSTTVSAKYDGPYNELRLNLTTLTGGTAPTVTGTLMIN